jgi:hypothetical protein
MITALFQLFRTNGAPSVVFIMYMVLRIEGAMISTDTNQLTLLPPVIVDTLVSPDSDGAPVYLFRPVTIREPMPIVFLCHGMGASDPRAYAALIEHIVGRGYLVCYLPYNSFEASVSPEDAYADMGEGCETVIARKAAIIDTTRVGFVGHSFGGGAAPSLAYTALTERNWGTQGAFLFIMAPWYVRDISQRALKRFPEHVRITIQIYQDDYINDHRIARDLFETIGVPRANKRFVTVYSAACCGYTLIADHDAPLGTIDSAASVNAIDSCALYPALDAVTDAALLPADTLRYPGYTNAPSWLPYTEVRFNTQAKPLTSHHRKCSFVRPQWQYRNFWNHAMNTQLYFGTRSANPLHYLMNTPLTVWYYCRHALWVVDHAS